MPTDTTPFDTFAQVTGKLALSPSGETHTEDKISVNARRIDFWFRADPAKAPAPGILDRLRVLIGVFVSRPQGELDALIQG